MPVKYIFVTGGVVSGLGKGITAASIGRLLKARGFSVTMQKFDPYINIDPGTMNPIQHGEVFVTDDGAETDLDLGHYERFIDESLAWNYICSAGQQCIQAFNDWTELGKSFLLGQAMEATEKRKQELYIRLYRQATENPNSPWKKRTLK